MCLRHFWLFLTSHRKCFLGLIGILWSLEEKFMLPWSLKNKYFITGYNSKLFIIYAYLPFHSFDLLNFKYLKNFIKVKNFILKINISLILKDCLKYGDYEEIKIWHFIIQLQIEKYGPAGLIFIVKIYVLFKKLYFIDTEPPEFRVKTRKMLLKNLYLVIRKEISNLNWIIK